MGRSQVKYRTTHGGRGRGRGRGGETAGADAAAASSSRRNRGGGGGRRPLESNAFRYDEHEDHDDEAGDDHTDVSASAGQTRSFQRQFFAGEESVREMGAAPSDAYFQSKTVKQWDAEDDDDPSAKSAMGVLDFNWLGEQLAMVAPSVRYQMDPKYCVDFNFEPQPMSDSEQGEQVHENDDTAVPAAPNATPLSSSSIPPLPAAAASSADSELDFLLKFSSSSNAPLPAATTSSSSAAATPQQQQSTVVPASDQLEDWLDDVLDM